MENILRTTPSYEELIEELDKLKNKIKLLEKNHDLDPEQGLSSNIMARQNKPYTNYGVQKEHKEDLNLAYLAELLDLKAKLANEKAEKESYKREISQLQNINENLEKRENKLKARVAKLIKINKALKSSNADLENFIYSASHDLRSPISNLEGLIEILKMELGDKIQEAEVSLMKMISNSISRFKQTILDLTEITTFQKQEKEEPEPIEFADILEDVKANIHNKIEEANALIETDFKISHIKFAKKNLRSIIFNLLINAVKYRSPQRPLLIKINTRKKGKYVILEIEDSGLGFLPEQKEKLFQMFKRLHTHVDGTGVGLYIVKKIVENSGGKIEVESELDKGSKFKIFFKS